MEPDGDLQLLARACGTDQQESRNPNVLGKCTSQATGKPLPDIWEEEEGQAGGWRHSRQVSECPLACPAQDMTITEVGQQEAALSLPIKLREKLTYGHSQEPGPASSQRRRDGKNTSCYRPSESSSVPQHTCWGERWGGVQAGLRNAHTAREEKTVDEGLEVNWGYALCVTLSI